MYGSESGFYVIGPDADFMYLNLGSNFTKWVRVRIFLLVRVRIQISLNLRKVVLNDTLFLHREELDDVIK
jgi:hypothetical protein